MNQSDLMWLESLARKSCGKMATSSLSAQLMAQCVLDFVEELSHLLTGYSVRFNESLPSEGAENAIRAFRLGNPRPGIMLLRGKEKLILSLEGARSVKIRLIQVKAFQEHSFDLMEFEPQETEQGGLLWVSASGQPVTAELVAKLYVAPFFVFGGKAFERGVALDNKNGKAYDSSIKKDESTLY